MLTEPSLSAPKPATCRTHPDVIVGRFCGLCLEAYCDVCLFETTGGAYCAGCMTRPSAHQKSLATSRGVLSMVGAVIGTLAISYLVLGAEVTGAPIDETFAGLVGLVALGSLLGGLTFGLIARDYGRASRSVLGLVGAAANGVLLLTYVALIVIGLTIGEG